MRETKPIKLKDFISHLQKFDPELECWYTPDDDIESYPFGSLKGSEGEVCWQKGAWTSPIFIPRGKKVKRKKVFLL